MKVTTPAPQSIWRVAVSHLLVILTAWLSIAPALHGAGHDQDCDPALVWHDESQHALTSAPTGSDVHPTDHCVACHLFRNSRHLAAWKFVPQALAADNVSLHVDSGATRSRASVPLPARAPPVLA